MRKFISLMMSLAIVMISSLPLVPVVSACEGEAPAHHAAMMQGDLAMPDAAMPASVHDSGLQGEHLETAAGQACIECGCGCHNSMDSLPHALAPHSPDTAASSACHVASGRVALSAGMRLSALAVPVFTPPPQIF